MQIFQYSASVCLWLLCAILHISWALRLRDSPAAWRLHIISVTGAPNYEMALKMEQAWSKFLGPSDTYTDVLDPGGTKAHRWHAAFEMDDSPFLAGKCIQWNGSCCDGYHRAQMKFVFGLVHEVRHFKALGGPMPKWWLLKDDDTFVHADKLMTSIASRVKAIDPMRDLIGFAELASQEEWCDVINSTHRPHCYVKGGSGLLLSNALAEKLALEHGDQWILLMARYISDEELVFWDFDLPEVISWIAGAEIFHNSAMDWHQARCQEAVTVHMRDMHNDIGIDAAIENVTTCLKQV